MVAGALSLVFGLLLSQFFRSSLTWQARNLRRTNLQQQINVALERIGAEMQRSTPAGITAGTNRVSIQKIADVSTDLPPHLIWETALGVYYVNGGGLHRRSWPPQPPNLGVTLTTSMPFRPDPSQLSALCLPNNAVSLGRNVTAVQVSNPNTLPLTLSVTVAEDTESITTARTLSLRNAE